MSEYVDLTSGQYVYPADGDQYLIGQRDTVLRHRNDSYPTLVSWKMPAPRPERDSYRGGDSPECAPLMVQVV